MNINLKNINLSQTFLACWSILLLLNFLPSVPQPDSIIGYLWQAEFGLAAFLLAAIVLLYKFSDKFTIQISQTEFKWIILPLILFTIWSGFSVIWATSARSAIHHTLLWACYIIFYLLIRHIAANPRYLDISLKCAGLVIFILGAACVAEYVSRTEEIDQIFTFRYYKYAEIAALFLPLFVAMALRNKSAKSILAGAVAVAAWFLVVLCLSRTIFIAGALSLVIFFGAVFIFQDWRRNLKKMAVLGGILIFVFGLSQISFSDKAENTTFQRFGGSEISQTSFKSRFLFWGIALEEFKLNPLLGVGADNYGILYKNGRENYSAQNEQNPLLEINEEVLAERTHNEFLQILAELGIIGAVFFGWLLLGILRLSTFKFSLFSIAAFAGITAFLLSSAASSYSFRVPANGLAFFFVLALFSSNFQVLNSDSVEKFSLNFENWNLKPIFITSVLICLAMLIFSAVRGTSLMYLQFALTTTDETAKTENFNKALAFDEKDAMLRYFYGLHLFDLKQPQEAAANIKFAIDNGVATSVAYFQLASVQIIAKQPFEAEKTLAEGLRVYPRSVFLRTAYGDILQENGKTLEAEKEFENALKINPEQARSWRMAFTEGMYNLSQTQSRTENFVKTMDLRPTGAIYALLDFQRQFRPNLVRR